jgi:hypothetical protein
MLRKKYIPLPIYNSNDVVMSCENRNFHLRLFVKGGALHCLAMRHQPKEFFSFHDFVMVVHQHICAPRPCYHTCKSFHLNDFHNLSCSNSIMFYTYSFQQIMKTKLHIMFIKTYFKAHKTSSKHFLNIIESIEIIHNHIFI